MDASTIAGKVLVGYQGWFRCPGDGSEANRWSHWSRGIPAPHSLAVDLYPDVTGLSPASRCALPGMTIEGKQAYVFSSFPKETAEKHFEWMQEYGIDGALIQRFASNLPQLRSENDAVLQHIQSAAEDHGRVFAVEYDLSGALTSGSLDQIEQDWQYLNGTLKVTQSPAYLKEHGKPIVSLWGLGFNDANHLNDPKALAQFLRWFKEQAHVTVMGGVPAGWGTLSGDSRSSSEWNAVYDMLDVVQPWNVGRYRTLADVERWKTTHFQPDRARTKRHHQIYMPVIFPGFSWHNLNPDQPENAIPRLAGKFLYAQAVAAKLAGAQTVKIAMFDEVNEGTAIFKAAPTEQAAPQQGYWLTLNADGLLLPSDWYLRLAGRIDQMFEGKLPASAPFPEIPAVARGSQP